MTFSSDSGKYLKDHNAANFAKHPFDPSIRAIKALSVDPKALQPEVFACAHILRSLIGFVGGNNTNFQFEAESHGRTVFFVRREKDPSATYQISGFNRGFTKAVTKHEIDGPTSSSHQRIVEYRLGNKHFLVRSETDGYLIQPETIQAGLKMPSDNVPSDDNIVLQGFEIPQNAVFDLKTRAKQHDFDMYSATQRLWVNQTMNLILAKHIGKGKFFDYNVRIIQMENKFLDFEEQDQEGLAQYMDLIERIVSTTKEHGHITVSSAGQAIKLGRCSDASPSCLSPEFCCLWSNGHFKSESPVKEEFSSSSTHPKGVGDPSYAREDKSRSCGSMDGNFSGGNEKRAAAGSNDESDWDADDEMPDRSNGSSLPDSGYELTRRGESPGNYVNRGRSTTLAEDEKIYTPTDDPERGRTRTRSL